MGKVFKTVILIYIITSTVLFAQTFDNFTSANSPLPDDNVNSLTISSDGTLWIGTENGLASLNNGIWKVYNTSDGLSSNKINALLNYNDDDNIWLGSDNGVTVLRTQSNNAEYINQSSSGIASNNILSLGYDELLNKWIGTDNGISLLTDSESYNLSIGEGLKSNDIRAFGLDTNNWVHIATGGGGVSRFKYNEVDGISSASIVENRWSGLLSDSVFAVYIHSDSVRWYGTDQGISTHYGNSTRQGWWFHNVTSGLPDNYVRTITGDMEDNIWAGTKGGVSVFDGNSWSTYTTDDGLISNNVFDIKADSANIIWIATDQGLSKLSGYITSVTDNFIPEDHLINLDVYPNPFNPSITIEYSLSVAGVVAANIYNINGELVTSLVNEFKNAGSYKIVWNGGNDLVSGIYILALGTSKNIASKKLILMK